MRHFSLAKAAATALVVTALSTVSALAESKFLILDILPLKEGATADQAKAYFDAVEPILAKYGMTRSDTVLDVAKIVRGSAKAQIVNLWDTDNPDVSFKGVFSDEDYKTHISDRDRIFDLEAATIIVTQRDKGN